MLIRDVTHNNIVINEDVIKDLISTYEFQRLRKIKQLGLSYMVFPSAEHSRFTHSVGVYNMAKNFISAIEENSDTTFNDNDKLALLVASLLHDVGHGPLSHTSEEFFKFDHEDYSIKIILEECTQINKVLKKYCPELIDDIVLYIQKKHPNKILNKILSGTIDIDRMDYLIRDSYHTGVEYGNFDYNRMVQLIDVQDGELVYLEKGINTIEDFIMCRYHMFSQVYLNQRAIAYEKLARLILERTVKLYEDGYTFVTDLTILRPFLEKEEVETEKYVLMNDFVLLNIFDSFARLEKDEILMELSLGFINQKIVSHKPESNSFYPLVCQSISKKIYNESVMIKEKDGSIKKLEDISQLVKFIANELKIVTDERNYYLEKNAK